ncbi:RipA family octameric membrane protein [Porphyromonas loveana]|uniref:RipA family octameric membrane protein n=1 Tax=Porphyromonas loveana TaxID=1884669 RepID=UPI0035A1BB01
MCTKKDDQVSLKEIRETFYRLRDFEISNLWQRSIFLSALLVLFFSGYGFLVSKLFEKEIEKALIIHELCCIIALLAIVFSIIWIMMAKGSKAWYEVYERRIYDIEQEKNLNIPSDYQMGADCTPWSLDSSLITTKPGRYSVSKLNILIGIILMITWITILIAHYIGAICLFSSPNSNANCVIHTIILVIFIVLFLFILITAALNVWAKSTVLSSPEESKK